MADTKMSPVVTHLGRDESTITLLRELVAHLRQNRTQLREEWARLITEAKLLTALYEKHLNEYRADKAAAQKYLSTGERPIPKEMDTAELAAWTSVTRSILNLHETITRN